MLKKNQDNETAATTETTVFQTGYVEPLLFKEVPSHNL